MVSGVRFLTVCLSCCVTGVLCLAEVNGWARDHMAAPPGRGDGLDGRGWLAHPLVFSEGGRS
jgi:hypothetical protein